MSHRLFHKKPLSNAVLKSSISYTTLLAAASLPLALTQMAMAEDAGSEHFMLEEVVVTAQKRAQNLQDVPISVAAMSGDTIQDKGLSKLEDISASIPTLHVGEAQIASQMFIRGIGSGVNAGFEQSVGTYIDGIYYGRGRQSRASFLDIERVEVLKGPQSILFGKNTIAGALNITTANPTSDFEGYVSALYEVEAEESILEAVVSGPVTENLSARLALRWSEMDEGWMDNDFGGGGEPQSEASIGRITLVWNPLDELEVIAKATLNSWEQEGRNSELIDVNGAYFGNVGSMASLLAPYGETGKLDGTRNVGGTPGSAFDRDKTDNDMEAYSVTVNYDLGEFVLTSVTGYTAYDSIDMQDNDLTPLDLLAAETSEEYEQFSQEVRLTSPLGETFEYIVGAYYQTDNLDALQYINVDTSELLANGVMGPPLVSGRHILMDQKTESWSVFSQLTWNVTDDFRATLGLRYSEDKKEVEQELRLTAFDDPETLIASLAPPAIPTPGAAQIGIWGSPALASFEHLIESDRDQDHFTPSLQLQWDMNNDVMLYASVAKGYKGGGFDSQFARFAGTHRGAIPADGSDLDRFEFDDEEVIAYEIGAKTMLLGGSAELNIALFRSEFEDVQVSTFDGGLSLRVGNAAETISQGVEVDGRMQLSEYLRASLSLAYVDAYYEDFGNAQCYNGQSVSECVVDPASGLPGQDLSDKELQFSPDWNAHFNLDYARPVGENFELAVTLDVAYSDDYAIANDLDPRFYQDAYTKVDLRVALADSGDKWEIALIGKNLTDEETSSWANDTPLAPGSGYLHLDRLRSYALQARYNF